MKKDILATSRGKVIKLADGKDYILSPYNLNIMANLEEEFECDLNGLSKKLKGRTFTTLRRLLWVFLRDNYPEITMAEAAKLVEMDQVPMLLTDITAILSGLRT